MFTSPVFRCSSPPEFLGHDLHNVTRTLEDCVYSQNNKTIVMAVVIPLLIIFSLILVYFVYKLLQTRKKSRAGKKNVRYSSVYKDTVETVSGGSGSGKPKGRPMSEL